MWGIYKLRRKPTSKQKGLVGQKKRSFLYKYENRVIILPLCLLISENEVKFPKSLYISRHSITTKAQSV